MPPTWFIVKADRELGPFTSVQLRQLAATGRLKPDDLVRKDDRASTRAAKEVKGLFQEVQTIDRPRSTPPPVQSERNAIRTTDFSKSTEWHYSRDNRQFGPVSLDQLKELINSGELNQTTLVWADGMTDWNEAGSIEGLHRIARIPTGPPPLPATQSAESQRRPSPHSEGWNGSHSDTQRPRTLGPEDIRRKHEFGMSQTDAQPATNAASAPKSTPLGTTIERCGDEAIVNIIWKGTGDKWTFDTKVIVKFDGQLLGEGSLVRGFHFSVPPVIGQHTLGIRLKTPMKKEKFYTIDIQDTSRCNIELVFSIFWANFIEPFNITHGSNTVDKQIILIDELSESPNSLSLTPAGLSYSEVTYCLSVFACAGLLGQHVFFHGVRPFSSPYFWCWGLTCLVLPRLVHGPSPDGIAKLLLMSLLRTIVFLIAGIIGGTVAAAFLNILHFSEFDYALGWMFMLLSLPTVLIPNRLDMLSNAAVVALFTATSVTHSRSAGLCPRCRGTGYCIPCQGRGVVEGQQCPNCRANGMCFDCAGTGGRSVL